MIQFGIDEVGRGAWAGPVVFAAIGFLEPVDLRDFKKISIRDSKTLSPQQRSKADSIIRKYATVHLHYLSSNSIDSVGLSKGLAVSIKALVKKTLKSLPSGMPCKFWIDGRRACTLNVDHEFVIKGDAIMPIISAASIVAKVERDAYMTSLAMDYPHYSFEEHKGYGTAYHHAMLQAHGPCSIHRKSYKPIANLLADL